MCEALHSGLELGELGLFLGKLLGQVMLQCVGVTQVLLQMAQLDFTLLKLAQRVKVILSQLVLLPLERRKCFLQGIVFSLQTRNLEQQRHAVLLS